MNTVVRAASMLQAHLADHHVVSLTECQSRAQIVGAIPAIYDALVGAGTPQQLQLLTLQAHKSIVYLPEGSTS